MHLPACVGRWVCSGGESCLVELWNDCEKPFLRGWGLHYTVRNVGPPSKCLYGSIIWIKLKQWFRRRELEKLANELESLISSSIWNQTITGYALVCLKNGPSWLLHLFGNEVCSVWKISKWKNFWEKKILYPIGWNKVILVGGSTCTVHAAALQSQLLSTTWASCSTERVGLAWCFLRTKKLKFSS